MSALRELLERDHDRLDGLLREAAAGGSAVELPPYEEFRAGLLRHIGIEEKILLPAARHLRSERPLDVTRQLRADHAALAALLVPTPTPSILATLRAVLSAHNPLEEGIEGMYAACEALAGAGLPELVARAQAAPAVPAAAHFDGERAFAAIDRLLRAAGRLPPSAG